MEHYGARFVYGDKAYTYQYTQKPYKDKILIDVECKLNSKIFKENPIKKKMRKSININNFNQKRRGV